MKQINMIAYICLFLFFTKVLCIGDVEYQEATKNIDIIKAEAKNPTNPGAIDKIIHAWENLKILDPETASKFSSYIDQLKNIFQPKQEPPASTEQKKSESTSSTIPTIVVTPEPSEHIEPIIPQPTPTTPTISQEIVTRLDQTAEAIKQAAVSTSTIVHEKAEQLCQSLLSTDLKPADESTLEKAVEVQTACSHLGKQITESLTEVKDTVANQITAMIDNIKKSVKKGIDKADKQVQELCESVKQAAGTFKGNIEDKWDGVKKSCTPLLTVKIEEQKTKAIVEKRVTSQPEGLQEKMSSKPETAAPLLVQPKTIKITEEKPTEITPSPAKEAIEKPQTNPFFSSEAISDTQKPIGSNNNNPFQPSANPFLVTKAEQHSPQTIAQEKTTTVEKKPVKKVKASNFDKLFAQLADFSNNLNTQDSKKMVIDGNKVTYLTTKKDIQSIESMYKTYTKLSDDEKNQTKNFFSQIITLYTTLLDKQANQIITLVNETLKTRINYLILWLDINGNIACEGPKQGNLTTTLSFNTFDGWLKKAEKNITQMAKQTEIIACSDDEVLFTTNGKEWEAVTTKAHVEKMIQEYVLSIDIIQKGIAEPVSLLINLNLKDIVAKDEIKKLQATCARLISVTESTVNFKEDVKTTKEQFFKDNGNLTILYNLWIRYFKKHIVGKGTTKWSSEQKSSLKQFNSSYLIPLHETMKNFESVSLQKDTFKKMPNVIDQYIKDND
ncbi:MAG TPA: hypothetical protein VL201_00890 [Patescibacteria group bacterium]|jgi:hypothetical protein|nr:hypothetical protein [Patescibacteria group bacterium]